MLRHRVLVAQDDELHSGSRHRHVHAAEVFQESYLAFIVGTYQRDEDHVSFLSLETIYRIHADQTAVRLEELILLDVYRPTDVVNLWGDPTKAKAKLNWNPNTTSFEDLVKIMVESDMAKVAAEDAGQKVRCNLAEYLEKGIVK